MRHHHVLAIAIAAIMPATIAANDRLTDRDVKALVERIDHERDRFEDALDGNLKRSVLRGPSGEVNVARFLDDLQENVGRLKERLKSDYAASAEVATVLRQGSSVERFFKSQTPGTAGESEWNQLAADLSVLARAYGTEFPLPSSDAPVRRVGDREMANTVREIARDASRLEKALDSDLKRDATLHKTSREQITAHADRMSKDAKALRERLDDGQPSSAEAGRLLAGAQRVSAALDGREVPASSALWSTMTPHLRTVARAYGASWPGTF